jgi:hypothetical protein
MSRQQAQQAAAQQGHQQASNSSVPMVLAAAGRLALLGLQLCRGSLLRGLRHPAGAAAVGVALLVQVAAAAGVRRWVTVLLQRLLLLLMQWMKTTSHPW